MPCKCYMFKFPTYILILGHDIDLYRSMDISIRQLILNFQFSFIPKFQNKS